ncbi:MAG: DUF1580 domain-containing protein [Planctomycetes bacterium]|nr:DUF1580 domain-containing protein [Planctomycetota bacterium]
MATEEVLSLSQAAGSLPGGGVHISTIHRWRLRGVRGVKLETVLRGGTRVTSREALARFFAATTAAANGEVPPIRTIRQRQRAVESARARLAKDGL